MSIIYVICINISLFEINLHKNAFKSFECTSQIQLCVVENHINIFFVFFWGWNIFFLDKIFFGFSFLNVLTCLKILKASKPNEYARITYCHGDKTITLEANNDENEKKSRFKIKVQVVLNIVPHRQLINDNETIIVTMNGQSLKKDIENMKKTQVKEVQISCSAQKFTLAFNCEVGRGQISTNVGYDNLSIVCNNKLQQTFSVKYLSEFISILIFKKRKIMLYFGEDRPLVMEYQLKPNIYCKYYLAPMVEDEAEEKEE